MMMNEKINIIDGIKIDLFILFTIGLLFIILYYNNYIIILFILLFVTYIIITLYMLIYGYIMYLRRYNQRIWRFAILETRLLINKLKEKGITFDYYSEEKAIEFLEKHNYYVKITAYKTNFHKHNNKYIGLDFLALKDLSTIDMHLKQWVLFACLSIEHSLKVNLLKDIQENGIDEYVILNQYFNSYPNILNEIEHRRNTPYTKNLLKKYNHPRYPVYVYFEVIPFGEFVNFYKFYCENYDYNGLDPSILYCIRNIRNSAAHNNCIIHDLVNKEGYYNIDIVNIISKKLTNTKKKTIQNRLKNNSIQDFVAVITSIETVINSEELKIDLFNRLKILFNDRIPRCSEIYKSSPALNQMYKFCKDIIDSYNF